MANVQIVMLLCMMGDVFPLMLTFSDEPKKIMFAGQAERINAEVGLQTASTHTKKKKPFHQLGDISFCSLQFSLSVAI